MIVKLIEFRTDWAVAEYEDGGMLQRRWIPRAVLNTASRGEVRLPDEVVRAGLDYTTVDLPAALGDELPAIRTADIQDRLRREGLWTKNDFLKHPQVVAGVVQRFRGYDVATIMNAARSMKEA